MRTNTLSTPSLPPFNTLSTPSPTPFNPLSTPLSRHPRRRLVRSSLGTPAGQGGVRPLSVEPLLLETLSKHRGLPLATRFGQRGNGAGQKIHRGICHGEYRVFVGVGRRCSTVDS